MTPKYLTVVFQYEEGANLPANITAAFSGLNKEYEGCVIHDITGGDAIADLEELMVEITND